MEGERIWKTLVTLNGDAGEAPVGRLDGMSYSDADPEAGLALSQKERVLTREVDLTITEDKNADRGLEIAGLILVTGYSC